MAVSTVYLEGLPEMSPAGIEPTSPAKHSSVSYVPKSHKLRKVVLKHADRTQQTRIFFGSVKMISPFGGHLVVGAACPVYRIEDGGLLKIMFHLNAKP
jgi:hypothetical protein